MKKTIAWILVLVLCLSLGIAAHAESGLSYEGTVVAGDTVPVSVPFGGRIKTLSAKAGTWVREGDVLAEIATTLNYAPVEGTIAGLYAAEGDSTESVTERYGAVMYIEPTNRYLLEATSEKAYNSSENYFIHLGETVYLSCVADGSHTGTGIVSALTDKGYNIEVTGGNFVLNEKVDVFRSSSHTTESRIGRGTMTRAKPVAVKGAGSILKLHVKEGDFVERGELLFETVEGALDGLYAPDNRILSPATGVIATSEKNAGDNVAKGDTLLKITPEDSFQVQFQVPEADLFSLQEGQPVTMELYWDNAVDKTYSGVISRISHMSEEQKEETDRKYYTASVSFTPDSRIRLGMTVVIYPGALDADAEKAAEEAVVAPEAGEAPESAEAPEAAENP